MTRAFSNDSAVPTVPNFRILTLGTCHVVSSLGLPIDESSVRLHKSKHSFPSMASIRGSSVVWKSAMPITCVDGNSSHGATVLYEDPALGRRGSKSLVCVDRGLVKLSAYKSPVGWILMKHSAREARGTPCRVSSLMERNERERGRERSSRESDAVAAWLHRMAHLCS